jgi:hypothetical protein
MNEWERQKRTAWMFGTLSFWMGVLLSATVITIILLIGTLLSVIGIVSGW